jgi:hypothetical protein
MRGYRVGAKGAEMVRWEYRATIIEMYPMIECQAELNRLGQEGWELIAIVEAPDAPDSRKERSLSARAFFKRAAIGTEQGAK